MNIFLLDLITVFVLNVTVFSLQIFSPFSLESLLHYIAHFRWSSPSICSLSKPLLKCLSHQTLLKPLLSWGSQGSIVQGYSPHKCSQEVWWVALNVVAATIPPVMSRLAPSPKLFPYGMTSSGNVPLTWPYCPSIWLPRPWYDTWRKYFI